MASWVSSSSGYNRCKQIFSILLIREIKDDDDDNDRKEILGSFVTKEKIIFNRRPKKNAIRQIRLNDRLNINADLQINIPDLEVAYYLPMRDLRSCGISDSSIKYVSCPYELLYNYLWFRLLHPN